MNKLDLDTGNFESRVMQGVVVARFKAQAMDILTDIDAGSSFLDFLDQVNNETDAPGYVQINDGAWDSQADIDKPGSVFLLTTRRCTSGMGGFTDTSMT